MQIFPKKRFLDCQKSSTGECRALVSNPPISRLYWIDRYFLVDGDGDDDGDYEYGGYNGDDDGDHEYGGYNCDEDYDYEYVGYNGDDADVDGDGGCDDNDGVQLVAYRLIFSCVASWQKHRTTRVVHSTR